MYKSCSINIKYPQIANLQNVKQQNEVNKKIRDEFLMYESNYCAERVQSAEGIQEETIITIEIDYEYYLSDKLLSILSSEIFSSSATVGKVVKSLNIDLNTGIPLGLNDLFNVKYKDEIAKMVIDKVFSVYEKDRNAEDLYHYYSSIKEDVFNRFQVLVLKDRIVFRFKGDSQVEPIYYAEIPMIKCKKFINKKYI